MRKITLFVFIAFVALACTKEETVTISGKISNPLAKIVTIHISYLDQTDTIVLAEDGTFTTEINTTEEYFGLLKNGNLRVSIYLIPGTSVNIELDADEMKDRNHASTKITGAGSEQTAFLLLLEGMAKKQNGKTLLKLPVDSFAKKMDDIRKISEKEIQDFKAKYSPSVKFIENVKLIQKIEFVKMYKKYIKYYSRNFPYDSTPIPNSFQSFIDEVPVDDFETCKEISSYKYYVFSHYENIIKKKLQADTTIKRGSVAYTNKNADEIANLEVPTVIKELFGYRFILVYSIVPDSIQRVIKARYKELTIRQNYIDEFEMIVATIDRLKPGTIAPSFNCPDINGDMVSSESLKGKVIYIDFWTTWCGPCLGEIPHLKKMEEKLHNEDIAFVSISIDEDKEVWEKMVREKELGGYQLFANEGWETDIVKSYAFKGIPYFVIIDKEGRIVNANASRPSSPKTSAKLLELAKKDIR